MRSIISARVDSGERKLPGCHLVDDDSQAEHVTARIHVAAHDLFGAHVRPDPTTLPTAVTGSTVQSPFGLPSSLRAIFATPKSSTFT